MDTKPSNPGLSSGAIPSGVPDAEALALFRKNQLNHPLTRTPYATKVRAQLERQKPNRVA